MSDIIYRKCRLDEIIELRRKELRKKAGSNFESQFENDFLHTTYHFGAFMGERNIGCASFFKKNIVENSLIPEDIPDGYQLRGMATEKWLTGKGVGSNLLAFAEMIILSENRWVKYLWCNARVSAQKFYEKSNWETAGKEFIINVEGENICHIQMFKNLTQISMR